MRRRLTRRSRAWIGAGLLAIGCAPVTGPNAPLPPNPPDTSFHVVALGDSFASGQGAPNERWKWWKPWDLRKPVWDDRRCHRSRWAATTQAVESLRAQGHTLFYESWACDGAEITTGLLQPYDGADPPLGPHLPLPPQVELLAQAANGPGGVQAVTLSIGGNDALFAFIVEVCIAAPDCDVIRPYVDAKLAALPGLLAQLDQALDPIVGAEPWRVLLLEYPNPTQASDGSYCHRSPRFDLLTGIDAAESQWAAEHVLATLNHTLCTEAHRHGWTWVSGAADAYAGHGWCADENWINTGGDSTARQRDYRGTMHPNQPGHTALVGPIEAAIAPMLAGGVPTSAPCTAAP